MGFVMKKKNGRAWRKTPTDTTIAGGAWTKTHIVLVVTETGGTLPGMSSGAVTSAFHRSRRMVPVTPPPFATIRTRAPAGWSPVNHRPGRSFLRTEAAGGAKKNVVSQVFISRQFVSVEINCLPSQAVTIGEGGSAFAHPDLDSRAGYGSKGMSEKKKTDRRTYRQRC